jgi:hypothetical protein
MVKRAFNRKGRKDRKEERPGSGLSLARFAVKIFRVSAARSRGVKYPP